MEQNGGRTISEPPLDARKHNTCQDRKKTEPLAADSAGEDGFESDERSQRQNTFTSLQDEVHKKRNLGMRYDGRDVEERQNSRIPRDIPCEHLA